MKMQEIIALTMYVTHVNFYEKMVDPNHKFPNWKDCDISVKAYWYALAEASLITLQEPDDDMIEAVLVSMRKPVKVPKNSDWAMLHEASFTRHFNAAIEAAKISFIRA